MPARESPSGSPSTRTVPLYIYKTLDSFTVHMDAYVRETFAEGIYGWQVTDCLVTMTECVYAIPDGPPSRQGRSTPADFRKLTPIVAMRALEEAGTAVCEPTVRAGLDVPAESVGAVMSAVCRLGGEVETSLQRGALATIESTLPAARVNELQRLLPGLAGGEGVLESSFAGYRPVVGQPPIRRRTTPDPRNRAEYLMHLARRVKGAG